jgi:alkylhydroperoxidase family enzyme
MPVLRPLTDGEFDPALLEECQFFKGPLGVIPNSVRTMARRPAIARAFTDLNAAVMRCEGSLTPEFKRLIGYITSFASGCRYCQAHTILASERFGSTEARMTDAWNFEKSPHFSEAEKAALSFAHAAATVPNTVTPEHGEKLLKFWNEGDVVELMGVIALFGFLNQWNDSMGTALEDLPKQSAVQNLAHTKWEVGKHQ